MTTTPPRTIIRTLSPATLAWAACLWGLSAGCDELGDETAALDGTIISDVALAGGELCESDVDEHSDETSGRCGPGLDRPYTHPLQGVALIGDVERDPSCLGEDHQRSAFTSIPTARPSRSRSSAPTSPRTARAAAPTR